MCNICELFMTLDGLEEVIQDQRSWQILKPFCLSNEGQRAVEWTQSNTEPKYSGVPLTLHQLINGHLAVFTVKRTKFERKIL